MVNFKNDLIQVEISYSNVFWFVNTLIDKRLSGL